MPAGITIWQSHMVFRHWPWLGSKAAVLQSWLGGLVSKRPKLGSRFDDVWCVSTPITNTDLCSFCSATIIAAMFCCCNVLEPWPLQDKHVSSAFICTTQLHNLSRAIWKLSLWATRMGVPWSWDIEWIWCHPGGVHIPSMLTLSKNFLPCHHEWWSRWLYTGSFSLYCFSILRLSHLCVSQRHAHLRFVHRGSFRSVPCGPVWKTLMCGDDGTSAYPSPTVHAWYGHDMSWDEFQCRHSYHCGTW